VPATIAHTAQPTLADDPFVPVPPVCELFFLTNGQDGVIENGVELQVQIPL
jgi:hypothetical protein